MHMNDSDFDDAIFAVSSTRTKAMYAVAPSLGGQWFLDIYAPSHSARGVAHTSRIMPTYEGAIDFISWMLSLGQTEFLTIS